MISAEYLRTGIISKLREGFRSVGLTAPWSERNSTGNPALARLVSRYLKMVQEQQAKAGVVQRQAAICLKQQLRTLLSWLAIFIELPEFAHVISQFELRMLRSFLASTFASSKRCDDICWILTRKIFRVPNNLGLIINFQFGKTLRQLPNHVFGVVPDDTNDPWYCPVKLMEEYVRFGTAIGVNMSVGYLYTKIDSACRRDLKRLSTSHLNARFRFYLHRAGKTTVTKEILSSPSIPCEREAQSRNSWKDNHSKKSCSYDAYWKNPSTAWRYIKLLQVVFPFKDFGVEMDAISPEDYGILNSTPLTQQGKWFQAFPSNADLFDQSELDLMQTEA